MAQLVCRLSPLVFGTLYRLLAGEKDYVAALEERLGAIELEFDWLTSASNAYDEKWASDCRLIGLGASLDDLPKLDASHAVLASWVLVALRGEGSSDDFSTRLRTDIYRRLIEDGLENEFASGREEFSTVVIAWVLGMVVHNEVDLYLPAVPAKPVKNEHIAAAYQGLVTHVAALRLEDEPWPDLIGTSTLVRGVGLAEALRPDAGSAWMAIKQLLRESARFVPSPVQTALVNHWDRDDLLGKRNAVVHIMPTYGGGLPFLDVMNPADEWGKVKPTIRGVTQFVFQEIARELAEQPSEVRPGLWEQLRWDIELYDV